MNPVRLDGSRQLCGAARLEPGPRHHAADSGLGAVLLSPSVQGSDFPLFLALLLMLVRLTAIWIVLPLTVAWGTITLWSRWRA